MNEKRNIDEGYICDHMLLKMARWLRIMGRDVLVPAPMDDGSIFELARSTGRVLLTRDKDLSGKRGIRSMRIMSGKITEQLREFLEEFPPDDMGRSKSRCPLCNGPLRRTKADEIPKEGVNKIPDGVLERHSVFYICFCNKLYWEGSHWSRIKDLLDGLGVIPDLPD